MYKFERLQSEEIPWETISQTYDSTIYKTKEWLTFLGNWKGLSPFVIEISQGNEIVGYFIGEIIKKIATIIASPFEGIGTAHQGLSMLEKTDGTTRIEIYKDLSKWIFENGLGHYLQVDDWNLSVSECEGYGVTYRKVDGYVIDLTKEIDILYRNLHQKSCRYSIKKSIKHNVVVKEAIDPQSFIEVYYNQLIEVFAKQGLTPTYNIKCVESLVRSLWPDKLLLLEAVNSDGDVMATGLFPGDKNFAVFWGGASYQRYQKFCPNEPLIWEAIKIWKQRGTLMFDMCGIRPYKLKFGPQLYTKPRLVFEKYPGLFFVKEIAKKIYYDFRSICAKLKR